MGRSDRNGIDLYHTKAMKAGFISHPSTMVPTYGAGREHGAADLQLCFRFHAISWRNLSFHKDEISEGATVKQKTKKTLTNRTKIGTLRR